MTLPTGRATKPMGKLVRVRTGKKDVNISNPQGRYPFFTCAKNRTYCDTYSFDTEGLLISGNGEYVGYVHYYNGKFEAYQRTYILDSIKDLDIQYLKRYLNLNLRPRIMKEKNEANIPFIKLGTLTELDVTFPTSPLEQSKIAQVLTNIDDLIDQTDKLISKYQNIKQGLMIDLFKPKDGWEVKKLGEVCDKIQYGYTASAVDENVGPKLLRITDIQDSKVFRDSVPFCFCNDLDYTSFSLNDGDILFARTGATTGKSFFVKNPNKSVFASYLIRIICGKSVHNLFIYYYLNSPYYWKQINVDTTGSAQGGFNANKLGNLSLNIPKDIKEQEKIASILSSIDSQIETEIAYRDKLQMMKKGMMKDLLSGRVRVKI